MRCNQGNGNGIGRKWTVPGATKEIWGGGFPGGKVVKNPTANAGHMGSIPGPGRSHMPWSN